MTNFLKNRVLNKIISTIIGDIIAIKGQDKLTRTRGCIIRGQIL